MVKYIFLILYIVLMILIGIISSRKIKSEGDYYVAGKRGNLWQITGSLLATILGSSAILGTADLAMTQGWAASWLLLSASFASMGTAAKNVGTSAAGHARRWSRAKEGQQS